MPKIVINTAPGCFGVSLTAARRMAELGNEQAAEAVRSHELDCAFPVRQSGWGAVWCTPNFRRDDPALIQAVEELGGQANGEFAELRIVDAPANWRIKERGGIERVRRRLFIRS